jgi:hypothetical protein
MSHYLWHFGQIVKATLILPFFTAGNEGKKNVHVTKMLIGLTGVIYVKCFVQFLVYMTTQ